MKRFMNEPGLLNGKTATTHWGAAKFFKRKYPKVKLKPHRLVTDEGDLFCSGGAKALLIDFGRKSQMPYAVFDVEKSHGDKKITRIQEWIGNNYQKRIRIDSLAQKSGLTRRTFERRFKNATGDTPLQYLQRVRIEKAKYLLESSSNTFEEITYQTGYEDSSSFRKLFIQNTGLTPGLYRNKFKMISDSGSVLNS